MSADEVRDGWSMWRADFRTHVRNSRSVRTLNDYLITFDRFASWARERGLGDPSMVRGRHIEAWVADLKATVSPLTGRLLSDSYVSKDYRNLRVFFNWWRAEEGDDDAPLPSPFRNTRQPKQGDKQVPVLTVDDLRALLATTQGREFVKVRDTAILRVWLDTGIRLGEMYGLDLDDVLLDDEVPSLRVNGKTGERLVALSPNTVAALTRYRRARARHRLALSTEALWLAEKAQAAVNDDGSKKEPARLGYDGLRLMLNRRARQAGVVGVHPHRFRHSAYDALAATGEASDVDAMELFGWKSAAMLRHYAKSNANRRALRAGRRAAIGDRV